MHASGADTAAQAAELVIRRELHAPRARVWQAFAEADRLAQWWGPKGCTVRVAAHEFRPGGVFHYAMDFPDGFTMWGRMAFREIEPPRRVVFVNAFSDAAGGVTRAPFDEAFPKEILYTLTLDEAAGTTTLTLRGRPVDPTPAEQAAFDALHDSMQEGFGNALDQLAAHLAETSADT